MQTRVYEINSEGIKEVNDVNFNEFTKNESSLYIVDLQTNDREMAARWLGTFNFHDEIYESLRNPEKHIRFEYFERTLYGELAYFSIKTKKPSYTGIINKNNIIFTIHEHDEGLIGGSEKITFLF